MKFSCDRKSSMYIYANEIAKGSHNKMELSLRKELEATKAALKLQTIRCRQLVAAFTKKLHEKELELRASKDLRNQQLSRLLRALLILESRLKKEQKLIRQQLEERDLIIREQEKQICKYKKFGVSKKLSKYSALENDSKTLDKDSNLQTGEERLDNLCKGLLNPPSLYLKQEVESEENQKLTNVATSKKDENTFKDNPVLESVNQILLRDEEELLKAATPIGINLSDKEERMDVDDANEWYETNRNVVRDEQLNSWCMNFKETEETGSRKDVWQAGKSSPVKSQLLEEKVCLEMSKKNLTVIDLEQIDCDALENDRAVSPVKSTASYEEIAPVAKCENYKSTCSQQKPPALPPKPARLLKPHQILEQKNNNSRERQLTESSKDFQKPRSLAESSDSKNQADSVAVKFNKPLPNKKPIFSKTPENVRPVRFEKKTVTLSEGCKSLMKPSETLSVKTKKNRLHSHSLPIPLELVTPVAQPFEQKKLDDLMGNCGAIKIGSSVSSLIAGLSREMIVTELSGESITNAKVSGSKVESIQDDSHVSQLVRQFEVLGKNGKNESERKDVVEEDDLRKNFEEFKLEETYVEAEENGRYDGDGAENKTMVNYYATLTIVPPSTPGDVVSGTDLEYKMYETFLENTGLSQKSILTPSRMLSNHRSCIKPKDVKHRNRVKAAAAFEKCNLNASAAGSTVKYWTEPFL